MYLYIKLLYIFKYKKKELNFFNNINKLIKYIFYNLTNKYKIFQI
jgi:hypothetical protein